MCLQIQKQLAARGIGAEALSQLQKDDLISILEVATASERRQADSGWPAAPEQFADSQQQQQPQPAAPDPEELKALRRLTMEELKNVSFPRESASRISCCGMSF